MGLDYLPGFYLYAVLFYCVSKRANSIQLTLVFAVWIILRFAVIELMFVD